MKLEFISETHARVTDDGLQVTTSETIRASRPDAAPGTIDVCISIQGVEQPWPTFMRRLGFWTVHLAEAEALIERSRAATGRVAQ
ncbi:hypothetical protein ACO2RV_21840 [Ancylobacter sp. VNQ12]|uniref:hypothetical protein n=1 Tax=Ancylobacter sp. VNQ12 TaxID=3400920 RepID=UPI003C1200CD